MSKPEGTYWTCKPDDKYLDGEEMVEPWCGIYHPFRENLGSIRVEKESGDRYARVYDLELYEKASDAWLAYAEWTRDRECHYADEHDRADTRLQEARKDESDAAKMKEILGDQ